MLEDRKFIKTLVRSIVGCDVKQIPKYRREEVANVCLNIFHDYIFRHVEIYYGKPHAIKLKTAKKEKINNIFEKFPELNEMFEDAYYNFFQDLDQIFLKNGVYEQ